MMFLALTCPLSMQVKKEWNHLKNVFLINPRMHEIFQAFLQRGVNLIATFFNKATKNIKGNKTSVLS